MKKRLYRKMMNKVPKRKIRREIAKVRSECEFRITQLTSIHKAAVKYWEDKVKRLNETVSKLSPIPQSRIAKVCRDVQLDNRGFGMLPPFVIKCERYPSTMPFCDIYRFTMEYDKAHPPFTGESAYMCSNAIHDMFNFITKGNLP